VQGNGQTVVETVSQVCSRGLRLKVGIDMGRVVDSVHPATGRMAYRGRAMNRAARISSAATSGQVTPPGKYFLAISRHQLVLMSGVSGTVE
jgi:class 3 adenylate cyclase